MGINKVQINKNGQIETLIDLTNDTVTENTMLEGVVSHGADGEQVVGKIATKTANNLSVSGKTVTVPAGYYASQVTKDVDTATQATPSISIDSNGLITASVTQDEGYVSFGTKSNTKQLNVFDGSYDCSGDSTGGSSESGVSTCTIIVNSFNNNIYHLYYCTYENNEYKYNQQCALSVNTVTLNNIICGSFVSIYMDYGYCGWDIDVGSEYYCYVETKASGIDIVPIVPNSIVTLTVFDDD